MIATAKCLVPRYHDSDTPSRTLLGYVSLGTSLAPCSPATPACGRTRSGAPSMRLPHASARPTRIVRGKQSGRSRLRWFLNPHWWSSNCWRARHRPFRYGVRSSCSTRNSNAGSVPDPAGTAPFTFPYLPISSYRNSTTISDSMRVSQWGIDGRLDRSSHLATSAFLSIASARNQSS